MSADSYNQKKIDNGELTIRHITEMVKCWQHQEGLVADGFCGPNTLATFESEDAIEKFWPLPTLHDGRTPVITSGFYTENPSRSSHKGVDMFYKWLDSDPDVPLGNGGAIKRNGKRKWWYPPNAVAIAAADGVVQKAGDTATGWRVWLDHGNGERTGYFHGSKVLVAPGDVVCAGTPLIVVGDNPKGYDAKHLHFEVSPVNRYAPMNPRTWLEGAKLVEP